MESQPQNPEFRSNPVNFNMKTLFRQRGYAGRYAFLLFEHCDGIKASHNSANYVMGSDRQKF